MMNYELTEGAEQDLRKIFRYTLEAWGKEQLKSYRRALLDTLDAVASGLLSGSFFSHNLPDVQVIKCRQHYVFYLQKNTPCLLVLAILHEKQHMLARLQDRLPDSS